MHQVFLYILKIKIQQNLKLLIIDFFIDSRFIASDYYVAEFYLENLFDMLKKYILLIDTEQNACMNSNIFLNTQSSFQKIFAFF